MFLLTFDLPVSPGSNIFHMPACVESIISLIGRLSFYISISILDMIDAFCPVSVQL